MEERVAPQMHKYGESKTTRIMVATVPHVTACAGRTKYLASWFCWTKCTTIIRLLQILHRLNTIVK